MRATKKQSEHLVPIGYLPPVPPMTVTISPLLTAALKLVRSNVDMRKETEPMGEKECDTFKPKINRKEIQIAGENCFILPRQPKRCLIGYTPNCGLITP